MNGVPDERDKMIDIMRECLADSREYRKVIKK